ncbi:hypothetical protein GQ53DRAFT_851280 [Thozetella sp. PMI_491]|nr:hypothetical protein GQ53DRAFT_851280 [Thozetella sp. PMI_491]
MGKTLEIKWERAEDKRSTFPDLHHGVELAREVVAEKASSNDIASRVDSMTNLAHRLHREYFAFVTEGLLPPGMVDGQPILDEAIALLEESMSIGDSRLIDGPSNTLAFIMYIREFPPEYWAGMLSRCEVILRKSLDVLQELWDISSQQDQHDNVATFYGISRYAAAAALQNNSASLYVRRERLRDLEELRDELISSIEGASPSRIPTRDEALLLADTRDIVVVNITDLRSDAIIISKGEISVVNLPEIDEEDLSRRSWEIQTLLAKADDEEDTFSELHKHLSSFLSHLYKSLARPVLSKLGYSQPHSASGALPHICWIPTGILCLYPVHAAGLGLHKQTDVMSTVMSSYASSVTSLWHLQQRLRQSGGAQGGSEPPKDEKQVCIVSMPQTRNRQPLELSAREVEVIEGSFPNTTTLTNASTQAVLSAMAKEPPILHLSCHGEVDYDWPLQSNLLTEDWQIDPLTVSKLQLLNLGKSRLAYLSACFTANAGVENQQDESVHLAGALQLAGFSNVIGAAWYVGEQASLEVMTRFYHHLARANMDAGWSRVATEALHFAVLDFRETTRTAGNRGRGDPVTWAPFMAFTC